MEVVLEGKGWLYSYECPECGAKPRQKCVREMGARSHLSRRALARDWRRQNDDGRKGEYYKYLETPVWKDLRAQILARDNYACKVSGCKQTKLRVHHAKYPKKLGSERLEWLHTVCDEHHGEIHRLVQRNNYPLLRATQIVLDA